jgi:hypothetical protein
MIEIRGMLLLNPLNGKEAPPASLTSGESPTASTSMEPEQGSARRRRSNNNRRLGARLGESAAFPNLTHLA